MSKAQREKGKRGERLWRDKLREYGFEAERAGYKQAHLGSGGADVEDNSGFWWEVKFVERLNVREAYKQASDACPIGVPPAVAHKTSKEAFLVTLAGEDFLAYVASLHAAQKKISQLQKQMLEPTTNQPTTNE
jgi:hypothetical protein